LRDATEVTLRDWFEHFSVSRLHKSKPVILRVDVTGGNRLQHSFISPHTFNLIFKDKEQIFRDISLAMKA
jgi:hypothetical protein